MDPLRILVLTWEYPPHIEGGLGSHVGAIVPALAAHDISIHVVTPQLAGGDERESGLNVTVLRVPPPRFHTDFIERVRRVNHTLFDAVQDLAARGERFDVIHAHDWLVAEAAIAAKDSSKTPLVATIHATERGRNQGVAREGLSATISRAEWELTFQAWRVITVSNSMASELTAYFSLPGDKIDVIPNGIDTSRYDRFQREELRRFRRRFAADDERLIFNVGRMVYEKGAHILVEAIPRVLVDFPQARFVLAGQGVMLETLERRADLLDIRDRCVFAGFVSNADRDALYAVADCSVFPSLYEPFGIVVLEAMAAGCPVVVSDVGGLAEVVQHQVTGLVVSPMMVNDLASVIREVLSSPEAAHRRAIAALDYVRREHSWERIANVTREVLRRVVRERSQVAW